MQYHDIPYTEASPLVVAGYIRRSSQMQKDNFSVDAQKRGVAQACQQRTFPSPVFYIDDELSARSEHIEKRPAFKQLLEDVTAGKVHVVIVHSFDRWSRNVMVTLQSFRVLADAHAAFPSLSERIDYSTPGGRLQLTILAAFAAYFLRMQAMSWGRIAEQINEAGYRMKSKRSAQRLFTADTVRVLLQNEFYAAYEEGDDRGTIVSHGKRYRGQHQAAFTREEWARIQQVSAASVRARGNRRTEAGTVTVVPAFVDTLVCAHCEQRLGSRIGQHHDYYKDVAHARGIICPAGGYLQVRQEVVTRQFGDLLQHLPLLVEQEEPNERTSVPEGPALPCEDMNLLETTEATGTHLAQNGEQPASQQGLYCKRTQQAGEEEILEARAQLLDITATWSMASPERRRAMITTLFEPGGLSYDVANERMVALVLRPPFVPWFRALPGAHLTHTDRGTMLILAPLVATNPQHVPQGKQAGRGSPGCQHQGETLEPRRRLPQRRPGPDRPAWKIDPSLWPEVTRRVEQGESLRRVARTYHVSYETIRRVAVTSQKHWLVVTGQG